MNISTETTHKISIESLHPQIQILHSAETEPGNEKQLSLIEMMYKKDPNQQTTILRYSFAISTIFVITFSGMQYANFFQLSFGMSPMTTTSARALASPSSSGEPDNSAVEHDSSLVSQPAEENRNSQNFEIGKKNADETLAIFYNVYIPANKEVASAQALEIVQEQVADVAASISIMPHIHSTLYYNTIGQPIDETQFQTWCRNGSIKCELLDHYEKGFEEVTLDQVHKYCQKNPSHRVTYIHNKGSFHRKPQQEKWRYSGTMAATHKDCINPPNQTCNMCSLIWQPFPFFHTSGNFWTADCGYVAKLVSPTEYDARTREFLALRLPPLLEKKQFSLQLYNGLMGATAFGTARFASEAWISSHPDLVPCDMSVIPNMEVWKNKGGRDSRLEIQWQMFPRRTLLQSNFAGFARERFNYIVKDPSERAVDFFLLPGLLFKWQGLYNATPPLTSWVWDYFPDGEMWKRALLDHGDFAVETITSLVAPNRTATFGFKTKGSDAEFFQHVLTLK